MLTSNRPRPVYGDLAAVRAVALAGPLGSLSAAVSLALPCAGVVALISIADPVLLVEVFDLVVTEHPAHAGLASGLFLSVLFGLASLVINLIPSGRHADRLSDGMFVFYMEQAVATKKQALEDEARRS